MNGDEPEVAVVTGASSGLGEAIARSLLDSGCAVITLQRRPPRITHERLSFFPVDLTDMAQVRHVSGQIAREHRVSYLVNNASANRPALLEGASLEDMQYVFDINLRASLLLLQAFTPAMRTAHYGRILSISSRAVLGKTGRVAYASAKAGVIGMARTLCLELAKDGITFNVIAPGAIATDLFDNGHPAGSAKRRKVIDSIPAGRLGTPDDVANAALFLLSRNSGYITGQTLFVCGGMSISGSGGA
ncbi:MAG: SDR family oxidoreductase [Candidimonas sp.]|nr:MAG: SDR family oxidoreductase [Candidimonas sp.]